MRINFTILLLTVSFMGFAASPFADRFSEHQRWIFPAYSYCFILGLTSLLALTLISSIYKAGTWDFIRRMSSYFIKYPAFGIISSGLLIAIPMGIAADIMWELSWFLAAIPVGCIMIIFPILLIIKRIRERYLLSDLWIKWGMMISISSILASLFFIILTYVNLLPGTDVIFVEKSGRHGFYCLSHPFDSMKKIWPISLYFLSEIIISLIFYWIGVLCRNRIKFCNTKNKIEP